MKINVLLFLLILVSCGTSKKNTPPPLEAPKGPEVLWNEMETNPISEEVDYTKPKVFHGEETIFTDIIHTKLEVNFDWNKSWMYGTAYITAKPHFYTSDSLILDAKGMEIKSVTLANQNLSYVYDSAFLKIKLNKTYQRTENYTIKIEYIAKPDERATSGSDAISSDKGLYFINPKGEDKSQMPQIWTQGETEASSVWFPTIDAPNVKTSQEIFITVANKYQTLSNGKLVKSVQNANGTRTDHWLQELPHAPYLFMMAVGEFKIIKDEYVRKNGQKMEVNYYVEPEWEKDAQAIFGETPAMIRFFSDLTGVEYPWDKYHQIVVREYVSGAMENTGAVIFGDYAYKTKRELLDENDNSTIAHELFHHWFGDLVTCESWSNLPLNESFANYSQYLWDEHRYGKDVADFNAEIEKEGYYASAGNSGNHNLIWYDYLDKEQMFDGHSYNKGGRILHMLRNYLGDEAFFAGLKNYLQTNQFKKAEFHHLRLAFEEVSGQDLNWFFNQWFLASGHPVLDVEHYFSEQNKEVVLTVYQNQDLSKTPLYRLPVEIQIIDEAGEKTYPITLTKVENKFVFPVQGKLKNVIFDKQQCLLGYINEDKTQEQFIHQYYASSKYLLRKNALLFGTKKTSEASEQLILDALNDPFWAIRELAIEKATNLSAIKKAHATSKILEIVKKDAKSQVRMAALGFLAKSLDKTNLEKELISVLEKDSSYLVLGEALVLLKDVNMTVCLQKAQALEKENASKIKTSIAQLYAVESNEKHLDFFTKLINDPIVKGYDKLMCLKLYTTFISQQKPAIQSNSIAIFREQFEKGGKYVKMLMPQYLTYFVGILEQKTLEQKTKLEAAKKSNNLVEMQSIKENITAQENVLVEVAKLMKEIEVQK